MFYPVATYGLTLAAVAAAWVARWQLDPYLGDRLPYVTFFIAVAVAAWLGGWRPALLATALGCVLSWWSFVPSRDSFAVDDFRGGVGLLMFVMVSLAFVGFGAALAMIKHRDEARRDVLRTTLAGIGDAVITTDTEARITYLNAVAERVTGWRRRDATGRPLASVFRVVDEDTHQAVENPAGRALREGAAVSLTNRTLLIRKDGTDCPIEESASPIRNDRGQVSGCVLIFRDVTCKRNAELELRTTEAGLRKRHDELEAIYSTMPLGMALLDRELRFVRINERLAEMNGVPARDHLGKTVREVLPQFADLVEAKFRHVLETGEPVLDTELVGVTPARPGVERAWLESWYPLRNDQGDIVGVNIVAREITDRRRAEEAMRQALADMQLLHQLATNMAEAVEPQELYERLMDAAVEIMRADFASMQLFVPDRGPGGQLQLLAHRGFDRERVAHWNWVTPNTQTTCSQAFRTHRRCHVADVERSDIIAGDDLLAYLNLGTHAVQSTPLLSRAGVLIGMISTHWKEPCQPSARDWRMFDVLTRHAADLLERLQAEHALRQSEQRFKLMANAAPAMLWVSNPDASASFLSRAWYEYTGQSEAEAIGPDGFGWLVAVHPEDRAETARIFQEATLQHVPFSLDYRLRRADGVFRWVSDAGRPCYDEQGRFLGYVGSIVDVHERKRAEQTASALAEDLRLVTDAAPALISYADRSLTYRFVNKAYEDWFGRQRHEMTGHPMRAVLGEAAFERLRPRFEAALSGQRVQFDEEVPYATAGTRAIHASYVPDIKPDGQVAGFFILVTDISERKQAEELLRAADRRKDEFLATLAHELRNPLAPLRNMLEIMKHSDGDADVVRVCRDTMDRQLGQLVRLVDDLLDVSRITQNKMELKLERVELGSVMNQAVECCRPVAEGLKHEVTISLPPEPIHLHADPVRLAQVFTNLFNNACKYTEPRGHVWLSAERSGSEVLVKVKDTGLGIPPEKLHSVFEMFSQIDHSLERSQGGLGIGLTLVKRLVEMHGGTVEARSEGPGRGSEFLVRLPILEDQAKPLVTAVSEKRPTPVRRILVVDDNHDSAISLAMLLTLTGNETHTAHDGVEAFEAAKKWLPEVVLLDIGLPRMNGLDVCRRIREQPWGKDMVLVALTGWGQDEDRRKSQDAGFDHHMVKPVDHAALMKFLGESPVQEEVIG